MTTSRVLVTSLLMVGLVAVCAPGAHAGPKEEARQHYQRGNRLFHAGKYDEAIRQFKLADRKAPSPILAFNIGLAHERAGNIDDAIRYYQNYLTNVPDAANRDAVEASLARLKEQKQAATARAANEAKKKAPAPESAPEAAAAPPAPKAQPAPAAPSPPEAMAVEPAERALAAPAARERYTYDGPDEGLRRVSEIDIDAIRARYRGGAAPPPRRAR